MASQYTSEANRSPTLRIAFLGDVMLGRLVNQKLKKAPAAYPWGDTLALLRAADWRICNLECVLSDRGRPWRQTSKVFHFRSDAHHISSLLAAHIDLVSLANNHVLDFEHDALSDMIENLTHRHILFAGAGANHDEALQAAVWSMRGLRFGFLAFTDNQPEWEANEERPGVLYVPTLTSDPRAQKLFKKMMSLKSQVDFLIVSAHWGANWGDEPPLEHRYFAHALIHHGADIVYGHSAHVTRGIEFYREGVILYGTGDFVDDYAIDEIERNDRSFVFTVEIEDGEIRRLRLQPTLIRQLQAQIAHKPESDLIINRMIGLCRDLGTNARYDTGTGTLVLPRIVSKNKEAVRITT